jgi:hypothetical protein
VSAEQAARLDDQDPRNWLEVARVRLAYGGGPTALLAADRAALYCPADDAVLRSEIAALREQH